MANIQFYLQSGEQRGLRGPNEASIAYWEDDSNVVSGQKLLSEKGSVRRCVVVMQQPVLLTPKFGAKSSHIFTQSP
jgi:hypothetical protein